MVRIVPSKAGIGDGLIVGLVLTLALSEGATVSSEGVGELDLIAMASGGCRLE